MSLDAQKNQILDGFIIGNYQFGELTAQKKKSGDSFDDEIQIKQVPFSLGVGLPRRARGIPYVVSITDKPDVYFEYSQPHDVVD